MFISCLNPALVTASGDVTADVLAPFMLIGCWAAVRGNPVTQGFVYMG